MMVGTRVITLAFLSLFSWRTSVLGAHLEDDVDEKPSIEADMPPDSSSSPSSGEVAIAGQGESQGPPLLDAECAQSLRDAFEKKNCAVPIGEVVEIGEEAAKAEGVLDPKDFSAAAGAVVVSTELPLVVPGLADEKKAEEQAETNVKRLEQVLAAETSGAGSAAPLVAVQDTKKVAAIRQVKENEKAKLQQADREEIAVEERATEDAHQTTLAAHTAANAAVKMVEESAAAKRNIVCSAAKDREKLIVHNTKESAAIIKDNIEHDRKPGLDPLQSDPRATHSLAAQPGAADGQPCASSSDLLAGVPDQLRDRKAVATGPPSVVSQSFETSEGDPL